LGDQGDNPVIITSTNIPFVEEYFFNSDSRVFYLAKTPADELILICVQGSGETLKRPYYRVLKSELDRFEDVDEIFLFKFDDMRQTWSRIHAINLGTSLFVGLNYPFHGTWSGTELSSIYVANMMDYDVVTFSTKGQTDVAVKRYNYPVKGRRCRMDLPGPTTSVGTRTNYSVGPWDYPACATWHLKAWSTRTTEEKYSVRKLYVSCTVWKTPRRTRLILSPYSDL
jgi:hypothetical protein